MGQGQPCYRELDQWARGLLRKVHDLETIVVPTEAHALILEANHDVKMLQDDTRRPWSTKQRI